MGLGKSDLSTLTDAEKKAASKKSAKQLGNDIHGSPDEWDYNNLKTLIEIYDKTYRGRLKKMQTDYLIERALTTRDEFGTVAKQSATRFVMWMPKDLQMVIQKGYPSIWTNEKHLHWFLKRFPIFRASEKL